MFSIFRTSFFACTGGDYLCLLHERSIRAPFYMPIVFCLQILTLERFQHLEFLIQFVEKGCEVVPFRQAIPCFANSDPDKSAVPAPAAEVLEWILPNIAVSVENVLDRTPTKDNGSTNSADLDMTLADASMSKGATYSRGQTYVEGISKGSVVRQACDIKGHSIKVSMIYPGLFW